MRWRAAIALTLAAGVVRLLMAGVTPLVPDEAYYWEWSRHMDLGYFDHPPIIALMIRSGTLIFGATALGVRFFPVLAGTAALLLVVDLARRHGGARGALSAAVITACVPLAAIGLVLASPDSPLLLAYAAGLAALDRALAARPRSRESFGWWLVAGLSTGIGLASKYTGVLLPLGVLVAFLFRRSLRPRLRTPEPFLAGLVALLVFAPVIIWNSTHQWASFTFQLHNGLGSSGGWPVGRLIDLLGNQMGLVSPILFFLLGIGVARALVASSDDRRFVVATIAMTTFGFFVLSALRERVEPNWPGPAYMPAMVLLAVTGAGIAWRRWLGAGSVLGAAMVVLIYLQALHPVLPIAPTKDPTARGHGWEMLVRAVDAALVRGGPDGATWIATNRYQDAAQLGFLLPGNPEVFSLNLRNRPNQYDYWPGFVDRARPGDAMLLVLEEREEMAQVVDLLRPHFQAVSGGDLIELRRAGELVRTRRIWRLQGWHGSWPEEKTPWNEPSGRPRG